MLFQRFTEGTSRSLSKLAWLKFKHNYQGMIALTVIAVAMLLGLFSYLIIPDSTPDANRQILEIATQKPGFRVKMLKIRKNEPKNEVSFFHKMLFGKRSNYTLVPLESWHFEKGNLVVKVFDPDHDGLVEKFGLADILYPLRGEQSVSGDSVYFSELNGIRKSESIASMQKQVLSNHIISRTFLLGTDQFGRDLLSRLILGTRISLSVGFISVGISLFIGILLGSFAGFYQGRVDDIISWFINVVWSIPTLLLVIAITFALGKGFWQIFFAVGLTMWVEVARVVRGQMMSARRLEYVEAGIALGFSKFRIMIKHILPNILSPVIVISAANFAAAILIEAGLSFLGIGVQPPTPSWGNMIKEYYSFIVLHSAYLAIVPGVAIIILVLAFMTLGNSLRDALDVRAETRT